MTAVGIAHLHFQAGLRAWTDHVGLVFFLWQLCSHLVNIRLTALVTSVSAALVQFVRRFSLVAARGQPRSPSDVVFFSLSVSLCVSLFCQVYGKVIPPSLRKFLLVPRVRQTERVWGSNRAALLQRDTPGLAFLFIFNIFYLVAFSEHVKTVVKRDCDDTFQPQCIQEGSQTLEI